MSRITKPVEREIIEDFAQEIQNRVLRSAKPSKTVINFRTDMRDGVERDIVKVPIGLLRFRKDNGRIASDVLDHENSNGILDEKDDEAQEQLSKFLAEKDPERTSVLRQSIIHAGQQDPAIITCDGFLINGNRRKMVMDRLHSEFPDNEAFAYMKVVILPGACDEGGAPTLLEIEKLENRYQLQRDGKSEYYGFDRALSIKRKIDRGFLLEEQLRDDPSFEGLTKPQLDKKVKEYEKKYLLPLECVDRYLRQTGRDGQYRTISAGMSDREGRWQAFIDYADVYSRVLSNPKKLIDYGIEEDEIGQIEEAAFNIIRLRTIPDMPKVHYIMRYLPKYCSTPEGKKAILKISDEVDPLLPEEERYDEQGDVLPASDVDAKWAARYKQTITYNAKKASLSHDDQRERETPLELLEAAHKKLTHGGMDLAAILPDDYGKARKLATSIKARADELEKQIYYLEKNGGKQPERNR